MPTVIERARAMAREYPGLSAHLRLIWARQEVDAEPPFEWDPFKDRAELERDGFTIVVKCQPDDVNDFSHLGKFVARWEPDAIKCPDHRGDSRYLQWFVPTQTENERFAYYNGKAGMAKEPARRQAHAELMADYRAATEYQARIAVVTASREGVCLGYASLGGIDGDEDYFVRTVIDHGLIDEAVTDAKDTLARLCAKEDT